MGKSRVCIVHIVFPFDYKTYTQVTRPCSLLGIILSEDVKIRDVGIYNSPNESKTLCIVFCSGFIECHIHLIFSEPIFKLNGSKRLPYKLWAKPQNEDRN